MDITAIALPTIEQLNDFVHTKLCNLDHLDPKQTPCHTNRLTRRGRPCGSIYHIEGPRLLRTSAIWSCDEHRILFYDSVGVRVAEVRLTESPDLRSDQ